MYEKIAAGAQHSLCIDTLGNALAWGLNNHGQLGIGIHKLISESTQASTPIVVRTPKLVVHLKNVIQVQKERERN